MTKKPLEDRRWALWIDDIVDIGEEINSFVVHERLKEHRPLSAPTMVELGRYMHRSDKFVFLGSVCITLYVPDGLHDIDKKYENFNRRSYKVPLFEKVG